MTQATKRIALYLRRSTQEQNLERQERDLREFAARCGHEVVSVVSETASGAKNDRKERAKVIELARKREIDAVLVTELSRWGRSTSDLIATVEQLAAWGISLICQTGMDFDLSTPQGKLMLTMMSGVSQFERDLLRERTMSGLENAKAKGKVLGRPEGFNPSDKYADKVLKHLSEGRTVRWISHEMQISTTTIQAIKKRRAS